MRAIRLGLRARAPVRPLDRLLLERDASADLPNTAGYGERRLGARDGRIRDVAVKLRGAEHGDPAALREQITVLRAERSALLDTYRGYEKQQFPDPSGLSGQVR